MISILCRHLCARVLVDFCCVCIFRHSEFWCDSLCDVSHGMQAAICTETHKPLVVFFYLFIAIEDS